MSGLLCQVAWASRSSATFGGLAESLNATLLLIIDLGASKFSYFKH